MGKFWPAATAFVVRFWGGILVALALLLGAFRLLSELVSNVNFIDDLKDALKVAKPVTDFFIRQPEWAFYPVCIAMILVGVMAAVANWRPLVAAIMAEASLPSRAPSAEDSARASVTSKWRPDMTMQEVAQYLKTRTPYAPRYGYDDSTLASEIRTALSTGLITAWARLHPDSEEFQVDTLEWNRADLARIDGHALLKRIRMPIRDLRFARGEIEAAWPPKT